MMRVGIDKGSPYIMQGDTMRTLFMKLEQDLDLHLDLNRLSNNMQPGAYLWTATHFWPR